MRFTTLVMGCLLGIGTVASAQTIDSDGCWFPRSENDDLKSCVTNEDVPKWQSDGSFLFGVNNWCGTGVVVRICVERKDGSGDYCETLYMSEHNHFYRSSIPAHMEPSGKYAWNFVGSADPDKALVCAGKIEDWDDPLEYGPAH